MGESHKEPLETLTQPLNVFGASDKCLPEVSLAKILPKCANL
jgi:hypothetical protein